MRVQQSKSLDESRGGAYHSFCLLIRSALAFLCICECVQHGKIFLWSLRLGIFIIVISPSCVTLRRNLKPLHPSSSPSPPPCPSTPPPPLSLHLFSFCLSLIHAVLTPSFLFCLATHTHSLRLIHLIYSEVSFAHTLQFSHLSTTSLLIPLPFSLFSQLFNFSVPCSAPQYFPTLTCLLCWFIKMLLQCSYQPASSYTLYKINTTFH